MASVVSHIYGASVVSVGWKGLAIVIVTVVPLVQG